MYGLKKFCEFFLPAAVPESVVGIVVNLPIVSAIQFVMKLPYSYIGPSFCHQYMSSNPVLSRHLR